MSFKTIVCQNPPQIWMVGEEYPKHIPNLKRCTPYPSIGVATTHVENANLLQDNQTFVEIDIHYESH